jgi:hypothetical protein
VISLAGTQKYAKYLLLDFMESTLIHEILFRPVKVGIWCAVSAKIVGPVFFNEKII